MRAVGFLAGAGTLLREAQVLDMHIVGNIDTRPYFRSAPWVWPANFDSPFLHHVEELDSDKVEGWKGADIALGHPPCGSFSNLGGTAARVERFDTDEEREKWHKKRNKDKRLLPLFIDLVKQFTPKTFALDNLPKMLQAVSESEWNEQLPGYKLLFLTIWNWDYGSPQRRKRLWVIGTRSKRRFNFIPPYSRIPGPTDAWEAIQDLPWQPWIDTPEIDHVHHHPSSKPIGGYWSRNSDGERIALQDFIRYGYGFLRIPPGALWCYQNNHGRFTHKPARARLVVGRPARTPSGNETLNHPLTGWPLTVRERARIMGWPDDFRLSDEAHPLDRSNITKIVKITGRAVPSEFPRYLIPQLIDHIRNRV